VPQLDSTTLREIVAGEVRAGVAAAEKGRWSAETLSEAIEKFLAARYPKAKKTRKQVGSKHREDVEARLAAFQRFVGGDPPVRDIARDQLKAYRDVLDQLPERFKARFGTEDMHVAIAENMKRKVPYPSIGPDTINLKWIGPVNRLFDWLVTEEKLGKNPCEDVRSEQENGEAANTKRLPFKPDQISKIFAITSKGSPKTALYWLPLLMLTTGARPNELAQLRTDDLDATFNGRPHLNVLCLLDDDDETADRKYTSLDEFKMEQRVKSAAARRMIPLHPLMIEAGFVDFVTQRHAGSAKQLFRELSPDRHGFWSAAISKRLNRIVRQQLGITNPRYSIYSFRHCFIDACRAAGIPEETRMKLMGHQLGGVQGIYGNPVALPHESAQIARLDFSLIDFGLYFQSQKRGA
jgi:integrase